MAESEVTEACATRQGIALNVRAVIAFKVGNDTESIVSAGQRFLSDQSQMSVLVGRIYAGHLRSIVGSITVEDIVTERQKLAEAVLDGSKVEMAQIGLTVDKAESEASQSGPLAQATAQREVLAAHTELATRNAELRKQQLVAEVIKPAEAEARTYPGTGAGRRGTNPHPG